MITIIAWANTSTLSHNYHFFFFFFLWWEHLRSILSATFTYWPFKKGLALGMSPGISLWQDARRPSYPFLVSFVYFKKVKCLERGNLMIWIRRRKKYPFSLTKWFPKEAIWNAEKVSSLEMLIRVLFILWNNWTQPKPSVFGQWLRAEPNGKSGKSRSHFK